MYMGRSESILTFFLCEKWASEKYKVEPTTLILTAAAEVVGGGGDEGVRIA